MIGFRPQAIDMRSADAADFRVAFGRDVAGAMPLVRHEQAPPLIEPFEPKINPSFHHGRGPCVAKNMTTPTTMMTAMMIARVLCSCGVITSFSSVCVAGKTQA